jgi:NADH-quinone oxidoreductase subunit N
MVIFMLSLAGIPATAGFVGKWQIFYSVVTAGDIALAITVALTSALGAFYYLRVVWYMLFAERPVGQPAQESDRTEAGVAVFVAAFATVLLGIVPGFLLGYLSVVR